MADHQFSIPTPDGWLKPGEKPGRVMIDCFGSGEYFITVRDKTIRFEWSNMFGPMPITKSGAEMTSIGPKHPFWRAASLWNLQGRRLDGDKAIWHEPKKPVLKHLGGRNYLIVEDGEPGHDW